MFLYSLTINNYRSLENVQLDRFDRFNVLIGRNNSGKSSVFGALQLLNDVLRGGSVESGRVLTDLDQTRLLRITVVLRPRPQDREEFVDLVCGDGPQVNRRQQMLDSDLLKQISYQFETPQGQPNVLHLYETRVLTENNNEWATIQRIDNPTSGNPRSTIVLLDALRNPTNAVTLRAKIAERSRRGKMRKAREGKVAGGGPPTYGFAYNEARDNYVVVEETMANVWRIFRMVGVEGRTIYAVKAAFDREGIPTPGRAAYWSKKTIRDVILDDSYKVNDATEIASLVAEGLLSEEVAAWLDPKERYGIWWYNRRRVRRKQTSEMGPHGPVYRTRVASVEKPRKEWIAVPIPMLGYHATGWTRRERRSRTIAPSPQQGDACGRCSEGCSCAADAGGGCSPTDRQVTISVATSTIGAPSA